MILYDTMTDDELQFIQQLHDKESRLFMSVMNKLLIIAVIIPIPVSILHAVYSETTSHMFRIYITGLLYLILFVGIAATATYLYRLHRYKKDVLHQQKIIETAKVTSKKYMPQNNTWHLYLLSVHKTSIEVSEADFNQIEINDEINIEYARYSHEYFGYY